jgi:ribosomal protein S18
MIGNDRNKIRRRFANICLKVQRTITKKKKKARTAGLQVAV